MESRARAIDTFQVVGFVLSTAVAIVLVVAQIDPMQSTVIGLILAILTQLFDLQLRHSASEERLLQASALSQALYRDPALLARVKQMVEDYFAVKHGWFELFKQRAEDAMNECHNVLRLMAEGNMEPPPRGQYGLSVTGFKFAKTSIKQVTDFSGIKDAVEGMRGWYTQSWTAAAQRGVRTTMVLVLAREDLAKVMAESRTVAMPIGTYVALSDELPVELDENYMIIDDCIAGLFQRLADGTLAERTVTINPVEVERMVKRFDQVLRYAQKTGELTGTPTDQGAETRLPDLPPDSH